MADWYLFGGACHHLGEGGEVPKGGQRVPRPPEPGETWNKARRQWVLNLADAADFHFSRADIETAHAIKAVEAAMILSGFDLSHGMLADEAKALGVDLKALAVTVHEKTADLRSKEAGRRMMKAKPA